MFLNLRLYTGPIMHTRVYLNNVIHQCHLHRRLGGLIMTKRCIFSPNSEESDSLSPKYENSHHLGLPYKMLVDPYPKSFLKRHIGTTEHEQFEMLSFLGYKSMGEFINEVIPRAISQDQLETSLPQIGNSEAYLHQVLNDISKYNQYTYRSYIGLGYYNTILPSVIQRHILENPEWYTPYTPYQPEISQGRLESLMNFQILVSDLTGLPIANASLLDEASAAGEAMIMAYHHVNDAQKKKFWVDEHVHPHSIAVLKARAKGFSIEISIGSLTNPIVDSSLDKSYFGALLQYPNTFGEVTMDIEKIASKIHSHGGLLIIGSDMLALALLKPPGEYDADICYGSSQRFGLPLGFGGPHAAFLSARKGLERKMPGRIVGWTKDKNDQPAFRLSLQTREQHIKRARATSNICTAQALPANIAAMFAVFHGPNGLKNIAERVHILTRLLAFCLKNIGYTIENASYFDTLKVKVNKNVFNHANSLITFLHDKYRINIRAMDENFVGVSLDETVTLDDILKLIQGFANVSPETSFISLTQYEEDASTILGQLFRDLVDCYNRLFSGTLKLGNDAAFGIIPFNQSQSLVGIIGENFQRKSSYLKHPTFTNHTNETSFMRYIYYLSQKELTLTKSMIPLGSCTMKLNSAAELCPISSPSWNCLHPFIPTAQAKGYTILIEDLSNWLLQLTGMNGICFMSNSGAQGEFLGLSILQEYFKWKGESQRNICIIPVSAHGTNPASVVIAGYQIRLLNVTKEGALDISHLDTIIKEEGKDKIAAFVVTMPSTFGLFEENIKVIIQKCHEIGAQVYLDGANLNAMIGLVNLGKHGLNVDLGHANLHKTFCIPHGGGGPGMGPLLVQSHLIPFLPKHTLSPVVYSTIDEKGEFVKKESHPELATDPIASSPYSSALLLLIPWMYCRLMGFQGLQKATMVAILHSNYMMKHLSSHYKILYTNKGQVAHEFIIDARPFEEIGIQAHDIAKRLQDYGFHAPTLSWPVSNTLMIEPTESEPLDELNRYIQALIQIRLEIEEIKNGLYPVDDNVLVNAPHTLHDVMNWNDTKRSYPLQKACFPLPWVKEKKFWPSVARVDDVYGDMNFNCSCTPTSLYAVNS